MYQITFPQQQGLGQVMHAVANKFRIENKRAHLMNVVKDVDEASMPRVPAVPDMHQYAELMQEVEQQNTT